MKLHARWGLSILLLAALIAQPALAYNYPPSSETIREAYFLGKADAGRRAEFFGKYTRQFSMPKTGLRVGLIQFETPYIVIAERVSQNVSNYFAPDAEKEFLGKPVICRVRVQIYFQSTYAGQALSPPGVVRSRTDSSPDHAVIRLTQHDQEILSSANSSHTLYVSGDRPTAVGVELDLEYDAEKIDSAAPATVDVLLPDGQSIQTEFDLASLR